MLNLGAELAKITRFDWLSSFLPLSLRGKGELDSTFLRPNGQENYPVGWRSYQTVHAHVIIFLSRSRSRSRSQTDKWKSTLKVFVSSHIRMIVILKS